MAGFANNLRNQALFCHQALMHFARRKKKNNDQMVVSVWTMQTKLAASRAFAKTAKIRVIFGCWCITNRSREDNLLPGMEQYKPRLARYCRYNLYRLLQASNRLESLRCVVHIDLDAFYCQVEEHDNPALRGHPVLLQQRGSYITSNYEARKRGISDTFPKD